MSVNKNPNAMTPAQGEFQNKVAPTGPITTKGHKPGVLVGNSTAPEFHAETYPPGTAPIGRSFKPNNIGEVPGQANNPEVQPGTSASDTLTGATSADVHAGFGHPGSGMTSQEEHGGKRKHVGTGLEGVGANASDPIHEQGHDRPYETRTREKSGDMVNWPGAEDRLNVSAEEVASERR